MPLRAETEITWREFPIRSQYSPEQWIELVNTRWRSYKQWTKERWEWRLRKDEQLRLVDQARRNGTELQYVEEGTPISIETKQSTDRRYSAKQEDDYEIEKTSGHWCKLY